MSYLGTKPGNSTVVTDGSVTPAKLTSGGPSWSTAGGVSLPRIDSSSEGGQLNFNRASDNTGNWAIDSFGSGSTPSLRFIDGANVRMSLDGSGNLQFNSGYGSVATAYGCRAWVNFNGTGTVAIRASGNVSSITDNGTGDYTVNFSTAFPDANYSVQSNCKHSSNVDQNYQCAVRRDVAQTTSAVRVMTVYSTNVVAFDNDHVYVAVFR